MATTYLQASDPYFQGGEMTPCRTVAAVAKSDTVDEVTYPKQMLVSVAGNVVCIPLKNPDTGPGAITLTGVIAGYVIPFRVRRVNSTGTTATVVRLDD